MLAAFGFDQAGFSQDGGATFPGVHRIENHQTRVLHRGVGIDKTFGQRFFQRRAGDMLAEINDARASQQFALGQVIV